MSRKLPVINAKKLIKIAKKKGFVFDRQKGSHAVYYRKKDKARIVIPVHSGIDLKPKTMMSIIKDMNLTLEEFIRLL